MKKINLFLIWSVFLFFTIIITIFAIHKIKKTNEENKLYEIQKKQFEVYISKNSDSSEVIDLLDDYISFLEKYKDEEYIIPEVLFEGKDNDNYLLLYKENDDNQITICKNEVLKIKSLIDNKDMFYIGVNYSDNNEFITKIIIEYNY